MKKYIGIILLITLLPIVVSHGQISYSVANYFRYGNGERSFGNFNKSFSYKENLTDVRINLPFNFTAGARLLFDSPPEIGIPYEGLKRRFLEFDNNQLLLRVGNFSELYGRGLALNLFESRGLGFDTWMDGALARYKSDIFTVSLLAGNLNFQDSVEIKRKESYKIYGGNIEVSPIKFFNAGFSFIRSEGEFEIIPNAVTNVSNIPSIYAKLNLDNFLFLFDYAYKETELISSKASGNGIYFSLGYSNDKIGITLDYKNYNFDLRDPYEQYDITRPTRALPFQSAPIVIKEHSYTLLTRALHEVDFNDELGVQLELFYSPSEFTNINLNASLASRHNYSLLNAEAFTFSDGNTSALLPNASSLYSPYYEIFGEIEHLYNPNLSFKFAAAKRSKILYDEFFGGKSSHIIHSAVFPLQIKYRLNYLFSFEFDYQYEAVDDNYLTEQQNYSNHLLHFITAFNSRINLAVKYEFTTNKFDPAGKQSWLSAELGVRFSSEHSAAFSYGSEKGGQTCSNGVCRYILPFQGFRFSLISNI